MGDGKFKSAWRLASNDVTAFFVLPSVSAVIMLMELVLFFG